MLIPWINSVIVHKNPAEWGHIRFIQEKSGYNEDLLVCRCCSLDTWFIDHRIVKEEEEERSFRIHDLREILHPVDTSVHIFTFPLSLLIHTQVHILHRHHFNKQTHEYTWKQPVGSVGFVAAFERKKSIPSAIWNGLWTHTHTHTHTHTLAQRNTHNCTMIFTSNIEEVMAPRAISLWGSAAEVHGRRFQSLIIKPKSHGGHADRHSSPRYIRLLIRSSMKASPYTYQSPIRIMVYIFKGTPRWERKQWGFEEVQ